MRLFVLFTQEGVVVCKDTYLSKRRLLDEGDQCIALLGPLHEAHAASHLAQCYPNLWPDAQDQLAPLEAGAQSYTVLTFRSPHGHGTGCA